MATADGWLAGVITGVGDDDATSGKQKAAIKKKAKMEKDKQAAQKAKLENLFK